MSINISVIIPTYNPKAEYLKKTVNNIFSQTFPFYLWELIIVDNASETPIELKLFALNNKYNTKIIYESKRGLTNARITGLNNAIGEYIVFVDDDNLLDEFYLENINNIFENYNNLGVIGGKSLPEFERTPEQWVKNFYKCLALRDLGDNSIISHYGTIMNNNSIYPEFAPIGAGMSIRRDAILKYVNSFEENNNQQISDRVGNSLSSGGDNDIVLSVIKSGYEIGYFPQLKLVHMIPEFRTTKKYLAKLNYDSSKSWVKVLDKHNICPWKKIPKWTLLPRKIKAFFEYKPWKDPKSYIDWYGVCGLYEGQADLN